LDYEDDPMYTEKAEMEELEKRVEILENKLMESTTIKINIETTKSGGDEVKGIDEKGFKSLSTTTDDDDKIDWDQIQESLDNNMEVDLLHVKKNREAAEQRQEQG
jgi:hypothetical protein